MSDYVGKTPFYDNFNYYKKKLKQGNMIFKIWKKRIEAKRMSENLQNRRFS